MERFRFVEKVAWKALGLPLEEAIDFIEQNNLQAIVVSSQEEIPDEPFLLLDKIWIIVTNDKISSVKMG